MDYKALGMIETYGYIGAIEAADICLKSANVNLVGCEFVKGGLATITIRGDVGAVNAAIKAAENAVEKVGKLISSHVIPRPSKDIESILPNIEAEIKSEEKIEDKLTIEELTKIKTVDLRAYARKLYNKYEGQFSIERNQIKYARKEELIQAILDLFEGGDRDND